MSNVRSLGGAALVLAVALSAGCIEYLEPGEPGEIRYFGEVRGEAPLRLIPPVTDRNGNVYVLFGSHDQNFVEVFVGHQAGGWSSGCSLHKGDSRGAHGWIGRDTDRAWYWSGDAVIEVSGRTGSCQRVIDRDPASNANLLFKGAIPMVRETPSRTYFVGLIQSPADRVPFFVVVDLDIQRYTSVTTFDPGDASNVVVLGTGADRDSDTGFVAVRYERGDAVVVEGLFLNLEGEIIGRAEIDGGEDIPEDGIAGYLQSVDGEIAVGVVRPYVPEGEVDPVPAQLMVFDRRSGNGRVSPITALDAVGVHRRDDRLYLAGSNGSDPGLAPLSTTGEPRSPVVWQASERFRGVLGDEVRVLDDRSDPRRGVTWLDPLSAIGPFHFVSEHSPDVYAEDSTGWLIAGPSFTVSGEPRTSVAFAPVGISYP